MRIKQHQSPHASVRSPDFVADVDTDELREVDIGIHIPTTDGETFIAIECRDRRARQSVEWIEQLISKKNSVKANVLIAVTASNFSRPARIKALRHGVLLARLSSKLPQELAALSSSLWLTTRYLAPVVHSVHIEAQSPALIHDDSVFRHRLTSKTLTLSELVQVWMNPNFVRSLPKYIDDFAMAKVMRFQLIDIDAWLITEQGEYPITKAELIVELNYGEEELTLRGVQELKALDAQPIGDAIVYDFGSRNDQLSEVIQDHGSSELRWDILAKPLLEEGKVLIGCNLRSAQPVSITTMRLDL
jgi:hypothetical protein